MSFFKSRKRGRQDDDLGEEMLTDEELSDGSGGNVEEPVSKKRKGKKRKKNMISKFFSESVWSQAKASFEANSVFIGENGDRRCYYGLAVTEEVLKDVDKVDREAKGSFIAYVDNGNILSYSSEEMLEEGFIVIIPDKDTMENLSEFGALFNRSLDIARVYEDGTAELNGYEIECSDVYNLAMGKVDAVDLGDDVLMRDRPDDGGHAADPVSTGSSADDLSGVRMQPKTSGSNGAASSEASHSSASYTEPMTEPMEPVEPEQMQSVPEELPGFQATADMVSEPSVPDSGFEPDMNPGVSQEPTFSNPVSDPMYGEENVFASGFDDPGLNPDGAAMDSSFGQDMDPNGFMDPGINGDATYSQEVGLGDENAFGAGFDNGYISPDGSLFGEGDDPYAGDSENPESSTEYEERQLQVVTQIFCPDDLNLEVSTAPFDAQFGNMDMVLFTETRPDGFFSDYLNSYCSVANVSLLQFRERNVNRLREMYLSLMGRVCDQISQDLNIEDPMLDTKFVRMRNDIIDRREQSRSVMSEQVSKRIEEIDRDWEVSIQHQMEIAADRAKLNFQQNFGRQHAQRKLDVESEVRTSIEVEYNSEMNELQELRRKTAGMMLGLGINEVLSKISDQYQKMQEQEQELYDQYARDINQYINDSRADEMARINTLANEQRQKAEAIRVREEMESRMASDAESFRRKAADYEAQIRKAEEEMSRRLKERDDSYREQLKTAQSVEKDLRNTIRQKESAMSEVEARVKAEYEHQLSVKNDLLRSADERFQQQVANMEEHNRYARRMNIVVLLGVAIATLFAGMMIGAFLFRTPSVSNQSRAFDALESSYEMVYEDDLDLDDLYM